MKEKVLVILVYIATIVFIAFGIYAKVAVNDFQRAIFSVLLIIVTILYFNTYLLIKKK